MPEDRCIRLTFSTRGGVKFKVLFIIAVITIAGKKPDKPKRRLIS